MDQAMSSLGLPAEESFLMQHFIRRHIPLSCLALQSLIPPENVARIALAIDYNGNGYRALLPMAIQEPALMSAAMAVAAAHYSRWQHTTETMSRKYLLSAVKSLRDRFLTPKLVHDQITLASMLLMVSYEVTHQSCTAQCLLTVRTRCLRGHVAGENITMLSEVG